ncbi:uncharacterized protein JCM6883_000286 [Sporobolomyces salmoneus]|uniref:uncharacterized protein n=1 Tax=Sporobolomyces salmoneus TaxID=183962 RepID=UPI0031793BAF
MSGFFTKIAHSPHVNLGDFKQLHEVLTSEKRSIDSIQKLSADKSRASNAIRDWGHAEGDDLGDVLSKVSQLFDYLAQAELAYAEHSVQYRLKFKEIRTMEENLSSLRRSRDQQGGKIEAQERKVSKMKEEHKDLPAAKQRLRELRDEMVGLENSVMTEDTRLSDFKRSSLREGLSLKLGALLELSEKTTVIAELGKLMVDELPTQRTQPGHPRAHYDGYDRTNYLLQEAQRCLQGVTFNPAPISEPYGNGAGTDSATQQSQRYSGEDSAVRSNDFGHEEPSNLQQHQYGSMASFQTPASSAFAQQGSAADSYQNSPRTSTSASHSNIAAYSNEDGSNNLNAPLTLASPQLNPLPDFQRLSFGGATPRGEEPPSSSTSAPYLAPPVGSQSPVIPETPVSGYQSNTTRALAPPQQEDGWGTNRTSLAYLGEAPSSDGGHGDIEAREAQQAFEDEAREKDPESGRRQGEFGEQAAPSRSYANDSVGTQGLATISEAMLEASPPVSQPATFPIPSPDVPSDVQPQSSIDSSIRESSPPGAKEESIPAPASPTQPREYQPLLDSVVPPPATPSIQPPTPAPEVSTTPRTPTSPVFATSPTVAHPAPLPIPSPLHVPVPSNSSIPHFVPPPSGFEPRPLTPRSMSGTPRQPISIKPQTASATSLGSRHGDIVVAGSNPTPQFIPSASSPNLSTPSGYFTPMGTTGGTTPTGENGKRTISAGAFRRPGGGGGTTPLSSSVTGINVNGGRSFAPSGYNVVPIPGNPGFGPSPDAGPSDAEQIAQSWRSAVPVAPEGYGRADDVPTPSFDTRPLQVNKNRMSMGGIPRPGTVPPNLANMGHSRSSSQPIPPPSPGLRRSSEEPRNFETGSNVSHAAPSYHSYAPPHTPTQQSAPSPGPRTPVSPSGSAGFGSNRFVTRLD